jgi:Na+/proline symporter
MTSLNTHGYTKIFNTDVNSTGFFLKQIVGGIFITVAMTGLDQEMMQKNISVRTLKDSQKNMISFSFIILVVNFLFLLLGGLLYLYAEGKGISIKGDDLFPTIALQYLPNFIGIIFIIGLISALFPSADGAITALTSSFCIDILGIKRRDGMEEAAQMRTRKIVHLIMAFIFMICVMIFKIIDNKSIITVILKIAGYTYGPLLGLFSFGILTNRKPNEKLVTFICLAAPLLCFAIEYFHKELLGKFQIGIELLILNGILTFIGLYIISKPIIISPEVKSILHSGTDQ